MRVCIIGGGLIGLFSAYYLTEKGYSVTLVDKGDFTQGVSTGNAGMICPSHFIPLAAPGVVIQSLKWMFNEKSPFYIKPRVDKNFIKWCLQFFNASTNENVKNNIGILLALLNYSRQLYQDFDQQGLEMGLEKKGIIMVCATSIALQDELRHAHNANLLNLKTKVLSAREIELLNPGVHINSIGGIHYIDDMHVIPSLLFNSLKKILRQRDITWMNETEITNFKISNNTLKAGISRNVEIEADAFLLAAGAWSNQITQKLNLPYLIEGGKGYNITMENAHPQIQTPMILVEGRVAVTPMGTSLRMGGTMEIAGLDDKIRSSRVMGILSAIEKYLPDYLIEQTKTQTPWFGYRPLSSDGMPLIKKIPRLHNAFINTGHGMLGLSLAPVSGKLIEEIISNSMSKT